MRDVIRSEKWLEGEWLEGEIFSMMDLYENSREYAIEFIKDGLETDEYRDELSDDQVMAVLKVIAKLFPVPVRLAMPGNAGRCLTPHAARLSGTRGIQE